MLFNGLNLRMDSVCADGIYELCCCCTDEMTSNRLDRDDVHKVRHVVALVRQRMRSSTTEMVLISSIAPAPTAQCKLQSSVALNGSIAAGVKDGVELN